MKLIASNTGLDVYFFGDQESRDYRDAAASYPVVGFYYDETNQAPAVAAWLDRNGLVWSVTACMTDDHDDYCMCRHGTFRFRHVAKGLGT